MNRKDFIRAASLASTGALLIPYIASSASFLQGSPSKKVVIGIMGTNSRGLFLAKSFARIPDVEIGYICDPDANVLARTISEVAAITGKKPVGFADIRKMLEKKDFDALVIAAPDHWHAPAAILGLQAGMCMWKNPAATIQVRASCWSKLLRNTRSWCRWAASAARSAT